MLPQKQERGTLAAKMKNKYYCDARSCKRFHIEGSLVYKAHLFMKYLEKQPKDFNPYTGMKIEEDEDREC